MKILISTIFISLISMPAFAEKPAWAGKGKPTEEQKAMHKSAMEKKDALEKDYDDTQKEAKKHKESKEKENNESKEKLKGLEKQKTKKADQSRNELDKGSEKGKEARENHSKKWWKFWGE